MTPQPVPEAELSRSDRRHRIARVAFGLNGAIFLFAAWSGLQAAEPILSVLMNGALGTVQLALLARSRRGPLPERLACGLAAIGMFASAMPKLARPIGLAYGLAGLLNLAIVLYGPDRLRRIVRRSRD